MHIITRAKTNNSGNRPILRLQTLFARAGFMHTYGLAAIACRYSKPGDRRGGFSTNAFIGAARKRGVGRGRISNRRFIGVASLRDG